MKRRTFMTALAAAAAAGVGWGAANARSEVKVIVYKNTGCDCCDGWAKHLRANGFEVTVNEVQDTAPYRARGGIPEQLGSCHTAFIDQYALEGHVPADDVKRLLAGRPSAKGLTAPGMPQTSPGMDGAHGPAWDVLLVMADGSSRLYHRYPAK